MTPSPSTATSSDFDRGDHFIAKFGVELAYDGTSCIVTAPVRPESFAPGTRTIRTAYLATLVDVAAGHAPNGAIGPTVDLRIQVFSPPPTIGRLRLVSRPLRVGSRLIVGDTTLHAGEDPAPFARAITTFMNVRLPVGLPEGGQAAAPMDEASFDEFLGATVLDATSIELTPTPRLSNGLQGTVQGGAQALLAEIAAEHLHGGSGRMVASDLDIRYLDRVRVGPLRATAEELPADDGRSRARVLLIDAGDSHLVGHVSLTLVPAADAPSG